MILYTIYTCKHRKRVVHIVFARRNIDSNWWRVIEKRREKNEYYALIIGSRWHFIHSDDDDDNKARERRIRTAAVLISAWIRINSGFIIFLKLGAICVSRVCRGFFFVFFVCLCHWVFVIFSGVDDRKMCEKRDNAIIGRRSSCSRIRFKPTTRLLSLLLLLLLFIITIYHVTRSSGFSSPDSRASFARPLIR